MNHPTVVRAPACRRALRRFAGMASSAALLVVLVSVAHGAETPADLSPEARDALRLIQSNEPYQRQTGFLQLEALRQPETAQAVRPYLDSKDPDMRAWTVRALAAVERQQAIPMLVDRLQNDPHETVRLAALLALEPFDNPAVAPALLRALHDRHPHVRMAAVDAVSRLNGPRAKEAIVIRWRRERNRDVRRVIYLAMKRIGAL